MILEFKTLENKFLEILLNNGFPRTQAEQIAKVFAESTLDGVFSHGINRFPRFIREVNPKITGRRWDSIPCVGRSGRERFAVRRTHPLA